MSLAECYHSQHLLWLTSVSKLLNACSITCPIKSCWCQPEQPSAESCMPAANVCQVLNVTANSSQVVGVSVHLPFVWDWNECMSDNISHLWPDPGLYQVYEKCPLPHPLYLLYTSDRPHRSDWPVKSVLLATCTIMYQPLGKIYSIVILVVLIDLIY